MKKINFIKLIILTIIFLGLIAIGIFFLIKLQQTTEPQPVTKIISERPTKFGLYTDDWEILTDTVKNGDFLGTILNKYGITALQIDKIAKQSSDTFRTTFIHVGQPYFVFSHPEDSLNRAKYFVYENSRTRYTRYNFSNPDSIIIEKFIRDIDTVECNASGIITSSLWNALIAQGYCWNLAIALSQTFAWTVDFYALQKGDWFKIVYDDLFVDGVSIEQPMIKTGVFCHAGRELWSIPFQANDTSEVSFYDTVGKNMKSKFLKAPLKYSRISSRYSNARMHPIFHRPTEHLAVDYAAPCGTPIYAACDGTITVRGWDAGGGNYIKIRHNAVYSTIYMHLSSFANYQVGAYVLQGEVIGYVGSTGWSTGCHLHYEIHENGRKIDPLFFKPPAAEPLDSSNLPRFNIEKQKWINKLNNIKVYKDMEEKQKDVFMERFNLSKKTLPIVDKKYDF
jgi:murein DD-endopeptidase MepM/ murein hydrolase activator NlpD